MSRFRYTKLNEDRKEIRLLRQSSAQQAQSPPTFELRHVSIAERPKFVALSYTWGSQAGSSEVLLEYDKEPGAGLQVTHNLATALPELVDFAGGRYFWIDAICINQHDDEEKSWQVGLMRAIYSQATAVFIWLGPDYDDGAHTLNQLDRVGEAIAGELEIFKWEIRYWSQKFLGQRFPTADLGQGDKRLEKLLQEYPVSYKNDAAIHHGSTIKFLQRPWWQRIWVFQEAVLPLLDKKHEERQKRLLDVVFACGNARSSLYNLAPALTLVRMHELAITGVLYQAEDGITGVWLDQRAFLMISSRVWLMKVSLFTLLRATSEYAPAQKRLGATDARDRIFGLLGMTADSLGIVPDYTKTCEQVYIQVAAALLNQEPPLAILFSQFPKALKTLPSWVPDWSAESKGYTIRFASMQHEHGFGKLMCNVEPPFKPRENGSKLTRFFKIDEENGILDVKGIIISSIDASISEAAWETFLQKVAELLDDTDLQHLNGVQYNTDYKPSTSKKEHEMRQEANRKLKETPASFFISTERVPAQFQEVEKEITAMHLESMEDVKKTTSGHPYIHWQFVNSKKFLPMLATLADIQSELRKICRGVALNGKALEDGLWRTFVADQAADDSDGWFRPSQDAAEAALCYSAASQGFELEKPAGLEELAREVWLKKVHKLKLMSGLYEDGLSVADVEHMTKPENTMGFALVFDKGQYRFAVAGTDAHGSPYIRAYFKPLDELAVLLHEAGALKDSIFREREAVKQALDRGLLPPKIITDAAHAYSKTFFEFSLRQMLGMFSTVRRYIKEVQTQAIGRRPFATSDGRPGLGPQHAEINDVVVALAGLPSLVALRHVEGNRYSYVGEVYVHGAMDGGLTKHGKVSDFRIV